MVLAVVQTLQAIDHAISTILPVLAIVILISSVDDVFLTIVWIIHAIVKRRSKEKPLDLATLRETPEKRLAVFVPLWHEHEVIRGMLEHNISAINYRNYEFFVGAYPNDEPTLAVLSELEQRFPSVHLAVCPHDGPTSKADCLNWIYQRMLLREEMTGTRFDVIMVHDAEDLVHPESFRVINYYSTDYGFVQVPVLPLPTKWSSFVHGIYCDEFSETQNKDLLLRRVFGAFTPASGVGTGYSRESLEKLASAEHNRIFDPGSLTEDYENGVRLHRLGCKQIFVPLLKAGGSTIATREFFPHNVRAAIRQRTRWVTGISLQGWEQNGWRAGHTANTYWFWRDRKGLIANPVGFLANLIFVYGVATWLCALALHTRWGLGHYGWHSHLYFVTLSLGVVQVGVRVMCVGRLYGKGLAFWVPFRFFVANYINTAASLMALYRYFRAKIRHEPLRWVKTAHAYPSRNALVGHKRKLGEILTGSSYVSQEDLDYAISTQPVGTRLGEYLIQLGKISENDLYEALSLQQSLPSGDLAPASISPKVARALPRQVVHDWKILPFKIVAGSMFVASPELPSDEMSSAVAGFTRLNLQFHLVTPSNFAELIEQLL